MPFDLVKLLDDNAGRHTELHRNHLNHQLAKVLRLTGFERDYVRAQGCELFDRDGNSYLDFLSGFGVFALGRNHPAIKLALSDALDRDLANLVQFDLPLLAGLLAEDLCGRVGGGLDRCFFSNSGAEAIESAIKLARRATGHSRVIFCDHAFHGLTNGALSLNGGADFREGFGPLLPGTVSVPFGNLPELETQLGFGDVAAFVIEPIQGKTVEVASSEYLQAALAACHKAGALLVIDEVQTGIGRTGKLFAYEHTGIQPDIVTMAKALSGGFIPIGATLCSDKTWQATYRSVDRALIHSTTFGQNTLAAVAGLATLQVIDDDDLLGNAQRMGDLLADGIRGLAERHSLIADVRGRGLMVGIEFDKPSGSGAASWRLLESVRHGLFSQLVVGPLFNEHGILTQVAADDVNIIKLLPPLIVGPPEVERFVAAFDAVLTRARHIGPSTVRLGKDFAKRAMRGGKSS